MATASDPEVDVWLRHLELPEEDVAHPGVVVLPGVDDARSDGSGAHERAVQRSHLHEIGPGPDNAQDFHARTSSAGTVSTLWSTPLRSSTISSRSDQYRRA